MLLIQATKQILTDVVKEMEDTTVTAKINSTPTKGKKPSWLAAYIANKRNIRKLKEPPLKKKKRAIKLSALQKKDLA